MISPLANVSVPSASLDPEVDVVVSQNAARFGWLVARVELKHLFTRPHTRFFSWVLLADAMIFPVLLAVLSWPWSVGFVAALIGLFVGSVALLALVVGLCLFLLEKRAWLNSSHRWYSCTSEGECGAYLVAKPGGWFEVRAVAASPQGTGLGEQLLSQIVSTEVPLQLWAVNSRVARWYARHGFVAQRRSCRGTFMTRGPR